MELDRTERRVLGALIEKRHTTPDQYPLSLNALIAACNQRSNRDPFLDLEEFEVRGTLLALMEKRLVTRMLREGGRTERYSERLSEELAVDRHTAAVLAELMLRGPQTSSELSRRAERMAPEAADPARTEAVLAALAHSGLATLLPRRPGERQPRWAHRLTPAGEPSEAVPPPVAAAVPPPLAAAASPPPAEAAPPPPAPDALAALREEIAELRRRVERLEAAAGPSNAPGN